MGSIFFDRQNTRQICKCYVNLIFQKIPQEIKILFLCFFILLIFPENTVPFINDNDKRLFCCR